MHGASLTKEDVEQSQEAEGHSHGQLGVYTEAQGQSNTATQQQRQEHHQPGELEQWLHLLASKGLHLI